MKNIRRFLLAALFISLSAGSIVSYASAPVEIESVKREQDGTVTVVLDPASDVEEIKILPGDKNKDDYSSAQDVENNVITGLENGDYTLFIKDKDGNVGACPLSAGQSYTESVHEETHVETWAESSSYEYGGSWIEYSMESVECPDPTEPARPVDPTEPAPAPRDPEPDDDREPDTQPAVERPETPAETSPAAPLPQTGGLDARMGGALGIGALFVIGVVFFIISSIGGKRS